MNLNRSLFHAVSMTALSLSMAGLHSGCATSTSSDGPAAAGAAKPAGDASGFGPNLALHKVAVSSSDEKGSMDAKAAVDGDMSTRWGSNFFTDPNPGDAWIYVDLGEKTKIQTVVLKWEAAYAAAFNILVSDDAKEWKQVYEEKDGNVGRTISKMAAPVEARYVKMQGIKRASPYGYSVWEFEVYGQ